MTAAGAGARMTGRASRVESASLRPTQARAPQVRRRKRKDGPRRSLIGRAAYWVAGARPVVLHRRDRRDRLGRRASAADPVARSAEAPALDPDRRPQRPLLATRGEMGGAAVPLQRTAAVPAEGLHRDRGPPLLSHYGIDPIGVARAVVANVLHRGVVAGRLDHHPAARQEPVPDAGAHACTRKLQEVDPGALARAQIHQGRDPRALSQPRLFRRRRLRRRGGGAALFRQVGAQA